MNKKLPIINQFHLNILKGESQSILLFGLYMMYLSSLQSSIVGFVICGSLFLVIFGGILFLRRIYLSKANEPGANISLTKEQYQEIKERMRKNKMHFCLNYGIIFGISTFISLSVLIQSWGTVVFQTNFPIAVISIGTYFAMVLLGIVNYKKLSKDYIEKYKEIDS